ncbi:MAG: hypothetical protein SPH93_12025 [Clostridium sp.]|uniref:hypothetical protein n=1 Tax=Clostridium sp. TaxID=1506 RepID=UPI002A919E2D|nr:hypothetical protein [Clostridium sp.]MDY6228366.1 hypothetical protein [Clostridium sp.]
MTLQEKQDILSRIFDTTNKIPEYAKEKTEGVIEGIIIGVSLRERMERVERSTSNG